MSAPQTNASASGKLGQGARAWLEARGLDPVLCESLGLTSRAGRDGGEVLIPYEVGGALAYTKVRGIDPKRHRSEPSGVPHVFWRVDCIADAGLAGEPLVITEGEFDAIAAIQAGFWRTVSVPDGGPKEASDAPEEGKKYAFVLAAKAALDGVREIIIATDGDSVGAALLTDLTRLLSPSRCKFIRYPRGCKDLNDVLKAHGVEGVRACIAEANWVRAQGVFKLSELPPLPPLQIWKPDLHERSGLNDLLTICPTQVSVWTGYAGEGKSTLLNGACWSIARREGFGIASGGFEATPQREYLNDATAFYWGRPLEQLTEAQIDEAHQWVEDHITFLNGDGYGKDEEWTDQTLDWFFEAARTAIVRYGCRIVVLDPWSQIEHEYDTREREDLYVRRALKRAKMFARSFDVHVAIVAHPKNPNRNKDQSYDVPDGYSVSGGAHWKNAPDLGVTAFRDPPLVEAEPGVMKPDMNSTRTLVRVWKKKNHRVMGKPGETRVQLDFLTGRYSSAETHEQTNVKGRGA